MKSSKFLKILLAVAAFAAAGIIYSCAGTGTVENHRGELGFVTEESEDSPQGSEGPQSSQDPRSEETSEGGSVCVYVCGAVVHPGVYYLSPEARVYEAVEAAGGFAQDADADAVNLAECIFDTEQIYIPTEGGEDHLSLSSRSDGLVNINTATAEELMTLPGIGQSKAADIIAYRKGFGGFSSIEEITNVSGIGEATFERLKDLIKV